MVHRTMQGKIIDMEKLMRQNELTPAVGNQNVNARGDLLGPGGKIIKKREDMIKEYYQDHPESRPTVQPDQTKSQNVSKKTKDVE